MQPKPLSVIPPPPSSSDDDGAETESGSETESDVNDTNNKQNDTGEEQNDNAGESTEEEEETGDDDEQEGDEKESLPSKKLAAPKTPDNSDDESDNDSESTELSPSLSAFTIKHHSKRPAEFESVGPANKKSKADEYDEVKKGATVRRWKEDDEILLLNGMIEYRKEKGEDPNSNMGGFYEYIKDSISGDLLKSQLIEKVRRLKKKYEVNVEKGVVVFSYSHDEKVFELSKKVWGNEESKSKSKNKNVGNVSVGDIGGVTLALLSSKAMSEFSSKKAFRGVKVNSEAKVRAKKSGAGKSGEVEGEKRDVRMKKEDVLRNYPCLSESLETEKGLSNEVKEIMRERLGTTEKGKLEELDGKWNKLKEAELELMVKRAELGREQVKLVLDLIKSDGA